MWLMEKCRKKPHSPNFAISLVLAVHAAFLDHPCGGIAAYYEETIDRIAGILTWWVVRHRLCIPRGATA